ncbi:hypothetical protein BvCmsSIP015_02937 [Escherichia coli]|nr:hypothetical protein BvCmsKKP029_01801 [Escherichia coli]GDW37971.1 hypothetical protein BvCmsSIP015_02937 [Escherichia coli]GDW58484.1 hypothetical protein BvCmsSIP068_05047 [Escherichia coli]
MVTRPAGGCDFVMTVHLNWVICRLASFIIAIVMLIAASVLLVWMFSAFHFLRIIFLNFNLILFIECFLVCCVAHHRATIRAVAAAGLTAGGAGFFHFLVRHWFRLFRFWLVL